MELMLNRVWKAFFFSKKKVKSERERVKERETKGVGERYVEKILGVVNAYAYMAKQEASAKGEFMF